MFERYTQSARYTVFRAKWEASRLGSKEIQPEHILLGLLGDENFVNEAFPSGTAQDLRFNILSRFPSVEQSPLPTDLPMSVRSKIALTFAGDEANAGHDVDVENWHILLGLLRDEESPVSQLLMENGLSKEGVRTMMPRTSGKTVQPVTAVPDLTREPEFVGIIRRATNLSASGKNEEALLLLDQGMSGMQDESQVHALAHVATVISSSIGDFERTESYCQRRLAIDPEDASALCTLADCLARQGKLAAARQYAAKGHRLSMAKGGPEGRRLCSLIERRFPELRDSHEF